MRNLLFMAALLGAMPLHAGSSMAKLSSITDGNTLVVQLRGKEIKVRMHGVAVPPNDDNRPILARLNRESSAFLKKYLSDGWVYLEFPEGQAKPDADGYVPAFVYRGSDAVFLNEKVVSAGLALVNKKEKNSFTENWIELQKNAKASQRGIWGSFQEGEGERIASGAAQGTYLGVPGPGQSGSTYVTYWIFLFDW
ncbi:MAG: thermonuclease family protein [Thermoanaerobaculia bacterium]